MLDVSKVNVQPPAKLLRVYVIIVYDDNCLRSANQVTLPTSTRVPGTINDKNEKITYIVRGIAGGRWLERDPICIIDCMYVSTVTVLERVQIWTRGQRVTSGSRVLFKFILVQRFLPPKSE